MSREETYRKGVYQCIAVVLQVRDSENQSYGEREMDEIGEGSQRHFSGLISERSYTVGKVR